MCFSSLLATCRAVRLGKTGPKSRYLTAHGQVSCGEVFGRLDPDEVVPRQPTGGARVLQPAPGEGLDESATLVSDSAVEGADVDEQSELVGADALDALDLRMCLDLGDGQLKLSIGEATFR